MSSIRKTIKKIVTRLGFVGTDQNLMRIYDEVFMKHIGKHSTKHKPTK